MPRASVCVEVICVESMNAARHSHAQLAPDLPKCSVNGLHARPSPGPGPVAAHRRAALYSRSALAHVCIFLFETCVAVTLAALYSSSHNCNCNKTVAVDFGSSSWPSPVRPCGSAAVTTVRQALSSRASLSTSAQAHATNVSTDRRPHRRLMVNDFNADFSRRLSFHNWLEEDVVLDRAGLERYMRRALATAGLARHPGRASRALRNTLHKPQTVEALQRELDKSNFNFDTAYAAQAHHLLPGAPWSQGRDDYMHLIRLGLRPNHYFLGLGCGPFAAGHHLVRYLLTARYYCIEQDEYLLRAAVEYEVPAAGLIHKRPRFLLNDLAEVAAVLKKPAAWLPDPPSYFDFVMIQKPLLPEHLERTITNVARYLRPRSGRLVVTDVLPSRLQLQLGLQPILTREIESKLGECPFSLRCSMHAYHT